MTIRGNFNTQTYPYFNSN